VTSHGGRGKPSSPGKKKSGGEPGEGRGEGGRTGCVPETAGRRRREAARWSEKEAEAAAAAAKGRVRRRRAIVARDLGERGEEHGTGEGGDSERPLAASLYPLPCPPGRGLDRSAVTVAARWAQSREVAEVGP